MEVYVPSTKTFSYLKKKKQPLKLKFGLKRAKTEMGPESR